MFSPCATIASQMLTVIIFLLSTTEISAEVSAKKNSIDMAAKNDSSVPLGKSTTAWELRAEQWELARSGETLLLQPALKQLLRAWLSEKNRMIEVQYPGGEDGEFWVQELTDWLVALGIPSKYIVATPGSGSGDVIKFKLIK